MKKYANISASQIVDYLEEKGIDKNRIWYLRNSITRESFAEVPFGDKMLKNLFVHTPSATCYLCNQIMDKEGRSWISQHPFDNNYTVLLCLEKMITEEENKLIEEFEDNYHRTVQKNNYDKKILATSKRIDPAEWNDPVFSDEFHSCFGSYVENVIDNIDEDIKDFEDFCGYFPSYISCSRFQPFLDEFSLSQIEDCIDWSFENSGVNGIEDLNGYEVFEEAYREFYERNEKRGLYWEDDSKIIVFDETLLKQLWNDYMK